jgi:hypothetical protein
MHEMNDIFKIAREDCIEKWKRWGY